MKILVKYWEFFDGWCVWCNSFYFITVDWGLITRKFIIWEMDEMDKIWPFDSYHFFNLQF